MGLVGNEGASEGKKPPFRQMDSLPRDIRIERDEDGTVRLKSRIPLQVRAATLPGYLRLHAEERPHRPWLSQRVGPQQGWRTLTFADAKRTVDSLTQALLDLGRSPGPLVILSGNSIEHAMLTLAAMQAGIVVAPISPSYSLLSTDFGKLRDAMGLLKPGLVFVQSGSAFARALDAIDIGDATVIWADDPADVPAAISYRDLTKTAPGEAVARSLASIDPDAVAKLMFTSGSTGAPKAVMQSQRNLCVTIDTHLQSFGTTPENPMVRLDWSPWNHVFGAVSLGLTLGGGGAFYIDDGRPVGPGFAETVRNLREISTTSYGNVPVGYAALIPFLEEDEELARTFFVRLETLAYAGARLPDDLASRIQAVAVRLTGHRVPFTTGFGCTETGPTGAFVHWPTDRVGFIGLPSPGVEMKLVPVDHERYDVRIRSGGVTAGYLCQPEATAAAFDDEGFYRMGDAAVFVDPACPEEGLAFAGRLSEEFKLQTGTFVRVGELRTLLLEATAPLLRDVVICGQDEAYIGVLAWLNPDVAGRVAGRPGAGLADLNGSEAVRAALQRSLAAHNAAYPGSSLSVRRLLLLTEPPSIDRGEITDKGSINQRAVQRFRASSVRDLFAPQVSVEIIEPMSASGLPPHPQA